ncbi:hypothetical protein B0H16DRAFT_1721708 [Mycena metata]|uniref:Transmembrane protein n=1 Tax=Mycena metata TaxID=1033252 RepID=A0AAD7NCY7_9AGAR|nr:hypothetical protein B0H16DRAFT_1721708 [Mycena metata]
MRLKSIVSTVDSQEDTSWTSAGIPLLADRQSDDLVSLKKNRAQGPWILSFNAVSALCVILHLIIVVLHIALLVVGVQRLEYLVVFPLERQSVISSRISGISTAFAALYSSILVLTSQTLAMRRNFLIKQTITATHDNITAWSGLGAAVCGVWNQRSIPASVFGTLSVFLYLLKISIFHISTLLSLQTFNFSLPTDVRTQGVPESYNSTELESYIPSLLGTMPDKMDNSNKLGLLNGTLYEVLNGSYTAPDTTVAAVGFNMTCQYLSRPNSTWDATNMRWDISFPPPFPSISLAPLPFLYTENDTAQNFVTLMTAGLEILDSNSMTPDPVILDPPMTFPSFGESVTEVQFLRCSQTLMSQRATVNTQTGRATLLERDILKQRPSRTWSQYQDPIPAGLNASAILNMWPQWLAAGYTVNYGLSTNASDLLSLQFPSMFLTDYLNLWPALGQQRPTRLSLNSLKDALSAIVGHATPGFKVYSPDNKIITSAGSSSPVVLLGGNATVYQYIPTARLHLSIEATSAGLVAAICLTVLSLSFCRDQNRSQTMSFAGSGFLQAIWLFRSHPDLETAIPNVENPTENNLRTAGMVPVKLFDPSQTNKY